MTDEEQLIAPQSDREHSKINIRLIVYVRKNPRKLFFYVIVGLFLSLLITLSAIEVLNIFKEKQPESASTTFEIFSTDFYTKDHEEVSSSLTPIKLTTETPQNSFDHVINKGQCMHHNDVIYSKNKCFFLILQNDGNLVIYHNRDNVVIWSTKTFNTDVNQACMQVDGDFVLYNTRDEAIWNPGHYFMLSHVTNLFDRADHAALQNDGQFVLKKKSGRMLWTSGNSAEC